MTRNKRINWTEKLPFDVFDQSSSTDTVSIRKGDARVLDAVREVRGLKDLCIHSNRTNSLEPLLHLPNLETLTLMYCNKVTNLAPLAKLPRLKCLMLHDLKGVSSLEGSTDGLEALESLVIWGNPESRSWWTLDSLLPLTKLKSIQRLALGCISIEKDDLDCLARIPGLKELGMGSNLFSFESTARLRALRPDIESSALRPWDGDPLTDKQIFVHGKGGRCIRVGKSEASRTKVSAILAGLQKRWDEIGAKAVAARTKSKSSRGKKED